MSLEIKPWNTRQKGGAKALDVPIRQRKKVAIYALLDPRDGLAHYVGRSNHPHQRLNEHRSVRDRSARSRWMTDLKQNDVAPILKILEEVAPEDAPQAELDWTDRMLKASVPLAFERSRSNIYSRIAFTPDDETREAVAKIVKLLNLPSKIPAAERRIAAVRAAVLEMAKRMS